MGCRPWLAGGFPGRSILVPVSPDGHRDGLGADQRRGARVAALAARSAERFYAPWDWVNTSARVMLVGITPGLHQATEGLAEARRSLANGLSPEDALRRADAVGSFSGPLRTNLVTMLDGIGLAAALGIESTAQLFDEMHHLAGHVSAIDYPVFVHGRNYGGRARPSSGIRCWPRWCAPAWEPGLRCRSTRLWCPWERPPRPPWTSWHVRDSWTVDGACSAFLILPEPTGIGSVCTPSGVPIWHALSSCGAPDWSAEFSRRDRFGGRCRARTDDLLVVSELLYRLS